MISVLKFSFVWLFDCYTMRMLVPLAIILLVRQGFCETTTRLTNLQCETMKPSYAIFHRCDLKVIGRGIVAANVRMSYTYTVPKMTVSYVKM